MSQARTTVEGARNHAFGAILLTFNKRVESVPVLGVEEVTELEVALFVADVEFRIVFVNRRVEFRTDRDVKMRAVADQGKECESERKLKSLVHVRIELGRNRRHKDDNRKSD